MEFMNEDKDDALNISVRQYDGEDINGVIEFCDGEHVEYSHGQLVVKNCDVDPFNWIIKVTHGDVTRMFVVD